MSLRMLIRVVLIFVLLFLAWRRFGYVSSGRAIAAIVVALVLLLAVVLQLTGVLRKPRNPRDEVPKRPLGLDG
jgi:di/tricarboxylate transporter